ncbi:MAG: 30S ribosomal protein THX [Cytophagaceae bacterium]
MGKGDKKSKKGKTAIGSFGVNRPKKDRNQSAGIKNTAKVEGAPKAAKPAVKKAAKKKAE